MLESEIRYESKSLRNIESEKLGKQSVASSVNLLRKVLVTLQFFDNPTKLM